MEALEVIETSLQQRMNGKNERTYNVYITRARAHIHPHTKINMSEKKEDVRFYLYVIFFKNWNN